MTEDAEIILVGMGTISLPMKVGIRNMRKQGKKVGLVRLRWFRPVPDRAAGRRRSRGASRRSASSTATTRSARRSTRAWSPTRSAPRMYNADKRPPLLGFICGLGGREVTLRGRRQGERTCATPRQQACRRSPTPRRTGWACASKGDETMADRRPTFANDDPDPRALQGREEGHHRGVLHLRPPHLPGLRVGAGDEADGQGRRARARSCSAPPAACTWRTRRTTRRRGWCRGCTRSSARPARPPSARRPA